LIVAAVKDIINRLWNQPKEKQNSDKGDNIGNII
jgi:hypothetical protein